MTDCHPCKTPLEVCLDYEKLNVDDPNCTKPCRSAIGCLMYAMLCTCPDLCATISILSHFQSKNNEGSTLVNFYFETIFFFKLNYLLTFMKTVLAKILQVTNVLNISILSIILFVFKLSLVLLT